MITLLPEAKSVDEFGGTTAEFAQLDLRPGTIGVLDWAEQRALAASRFWDLPSALSGDPDSALPVLLESGLDGVAAADLELLREQGYVLEIVPEGVTLRYEQRQGFLNGLTSLKLLLTTQDAATPGGAASFVLPTCRIVDHPAIPVRAVAPTFSWYAGYGRLGFDMQLWGYEEWVSYLNHCLDYKINQLNMVMYGYWPFEFDKYPETVFRDIGVEIWNGENARWLKVKFSHPNIVDGYLGHFLDLAHRLGVKVLAYVGLNSYNGGWTIKHPEKRMTPPAGSGFLNDFDSLCLSDDENVTYLLDSMRTIAGLGFDGFTLEESEEGFWFCECDRCRERWHGRASSPGEAKHLANWWLLQQIYDTVRAVNPQAIVGIRAFRQPPLEKDPEFLAEAVRSMPSDVMLFWAPALYVPPTEFDKWIAAFGADRIWGRDSESNAITSTMGRLFRVFDRNLVRYVDEPNVQSIERDIEQHLSSVAKRVHGINGYMFEWFGLFMHQWAHGNYGWGSRLDPDRFYLLSCEQAFGPALGPRVLAVLRGILTIHESQIPLYTTPFPFQANTMTDADIPRIRAAIDDHEHLLSEIRALRAQFAAHPRLRTWDNHWARLDNAERRNRAIYDLVLAALDYERSVDPEARAAALDRVEAANEADFAIAKEMFFDLNPVGETGVRSCMMPYHELKRVLGNLRHPDAQDPNPICSGIEALGWLWLSNGGE